jgi:hypothetical protein
MEAMNANMTRSLSLAEITEAITYDFIHNKKRNCLRPNMSQP